jgi:hypothetical protein
VRKNLGALPRLSGANKTETCRVSVDAENRVSAYRGLLLRMARVHIRRYSDASDRRRSDKETQSMQRLRLISDMLDSAEKTRKEKKK